MFPFTAVIFGGGVILLDYINKIAPYPLIGLVSYFTWGLFENTKVFSVRYYPGQSIRMHWQESNFRFDLFACENPHYRCHTQNYAPSRLRTPGKCETYLRRNISYSCSRTLLSIELFILGSENNHTTWTLHLQQSDSQSSRALRQCRMRYDYFKGTS